MQLSVAERRQGDDQDTLSGFLASLFAAWRDTGVGAVVLRNYESLPRSMGNDLDILVRDLRAAERVLLECARCAGYRLCHAVAFGSHSYYFSDAALGRPIRIDLMTRLDWYGFEILASGQVFSRARARDCFRIPHRTHEAALKLQLRLLYHGYVPDKYRPFIRDAFAADRDFAVTTLEYAFGSRLARTLVDAAMREAWGVIESRYQYLRAAVALRSCLMRPRTTVALWLGDSARRVRRVLQPAGLSVALLGPDGSGKSSAARALLERSDLPLYRDYGRCIHWKPEVLPRLGRRRGSAATSMAPHATPPRNVVASACYFLVHLAEFLIGALVRIRPALYANGLVVLDRYYYDFWVDPARYRLRLPGYLIELGCRLIPRADMVFVLDASPATLLSRKREVPAEEAVRQRAAFRRLADRTPNAFLIDASQPLGSVADEIRRRVMEHLSVRAGRRLRRPEAAG